jgi:hypothetical protein
MLFDDEVVIRVVFGFGCGFGIGLYEMSWELGEALARAAGVELVGRKDSVDFDWFVH